MDKLFESICVGLFTTAFWMAMIFVISALFGAVAIELGLVTEVDPTLLKQMRPF